jgi:hypothetical protein
MCRGQEQLKECEKDACKRREHGKRSRPGRHYFYSSRKVRDFRGRHQSSSEPNKLGLTLSQDN